MFARYTAVLPEEKAKLFVEQIFAVFDTDNSGTIDFKANFSRYSLFITFKQSNDIYWTNEPTSQGTNRLVSKLYFLF